MTYIPRHESMLIPMFISPYIGFSVAARKILVQRYLEFYGAEVLREREMLAVERARRSRENKRAQRRRYREKHREKHRASRRRAAARRRERKKSDPAVIEAKRLRLVEMRKRFLHRKRLKKARYRGRKRGASGKPTKGIVGVLLARQRERCPACGIDISEEYHLDHVVPLFKGGSNADENLQLLCPSCNREKSDKDPAEFMREKGFLL